MNEICSEEVVAVTPSYNMEEDRQGNRKNLLLPLRQDVTYPKLVLSCSIAKDDVEFLSLPPLPLTAGITGMCHHTWVMWCKGLNLGPCVF